MKIDPSRVADKHVLWALIRDLGRFWKEEESEVKEYGKLIYDANTDDLKGCIICFQNLVDQAKLITPKLFEKDRDLDKENSAEGSPRTESFC